MNLFQDEEEPVYNQVYTIRQYVYITLMISSVKHGFIKTHQALTKYRQFNVSLIF